MDNKIKVTPQNTSLEFKILGGMLIDNSCIMDVTDIIHRDCFFDTRHKIIYDTIVKLNNQNIAIDAIVLYEALKATGDSENVGGLNYISKLSSDVSSTAHIKAHCQIIDGLWTRRELISKGSSIASSAFDDKQDPQDILDQAEKDIMKIGNKNNNSKISPINAILGRTIERIEKVTKGDAFDRIIPTGFDIDNKIIGMEKQELIILAARPAMGKTALALNIANNVAKVTPTLVWSGEMGEDQLTMRQISSESGISSTALRIGAIQPGDEVKISRASGKLSRLKLFIDDTPALHINKFRSICRKAKMEHDIGFIVVDYLQLMRSDKEQNKNLEVGRISNGLKQIAKELDVPVLALSQLNRGVDTRTTKMPVLSDLRESGEIEQDADMVIFIHRPEYYGIEVDSNGVSTEGVANIIVAKNRNGPVGEVKLKFIPELTKFANFVVYEDNLPPELRF